MELSENLFIADVTMLFELMKKIDLEQKDYDELLHIVL